MLLREPWVYLRHPQVCGSRQVFTSSGFLLQEQQRQKKSDSLLWKAPYCMYGAQVDSGRSHWQDEGKESFLGTVNGWQFACQSGTRKQNISNRKSWVRSFFFFFLVGEEEEVHWKMILPSKYHRCRCCCRRLSCLINNTGFQGMSLAPEKPGDQGPSFISKRQALPSSSSSQAIRIIHQETYHFVHTTTVDTLCLHVVVSDRADQCRSIVVWFGVARSSGSCRRGGPPVGDS